MLISFSVENFRSFKEEATLSMVAGNGKEMRDSHVFTPKMQNKVKSIDLLRSAVIYGPNASGKSNFFDAFLTMTAIISNSNKGLETIPVFPFLLSNTTNTAPSVFEIVMLIDGVRYQYGFSTTQEKIHDEWLLAFPKGRTQTWFERTYNKKTNKHDYILGDILKGQKEVWREATNPKALFLSTAVQLNSTQLQPIYNWLVASTSMLFINSDGMPPQLSLVHCKELGSENIIKFLKAADFAIEDIKIEEMSMPSKGTNQIPNAPNTGEIKEEKQLYVRTIHKTEEGNYIGLPLEMESDGTRRMFSLAAPFLYILERGAILVVDELNQRLHPHLMRYLIDLFNNPKTNPNNAQLIFTTHAVSLLKNDIFRRDQIWFCEREKNQATILFPLSYFKPRKGHEDFEGYYMGGRYGALPFIGDFSKAIAKNKNK